MPLHAHTGTQTSQTTTHAGLSAATKPAPPSLLPCLMAQASDNPAHKQTNKTRNQESSQQRLERASPLHGCALRCEHWLLSRHLQCLKQRANKQKRKKVLLGWLVRPPAALHRAKGSSEHTTKGKASKQTEGTKQAKTFKLLGSLLDGYQESCDFAHNACIIRRSSAFGQAGLKLGHKGRTLHGQTKIRVRATKF